MSTAWSPPRLAILGSATTGDGRRPRETRSIGFRDQFVLTNDAAGARLRGLTRPSTMAWPWRTSRQDASIPGRKTRLLNRVVTCHANGEIESSSSRSEDVVRRSRRVLGKNAS